MMPLVYACSGGKREGRKEGREGERDNGEFIQYVEICTHIKFQYKQKPQ